MGDCIKEGILCEAKHTIFSVRVPARYNVSLSGLGTLKFVQDDGPLRKRDRLFKRNCKLAEKSIPMRDIKSIDRRTSSGTGLVIHMKHVASSLLSGATLHLDAETKEERESWIEEIDKLIWTNTTGGLNLVREEIAESIHKYYHFKLRTKDGVLGSGMSGEVRKIIRKEDDKAFAVKTINLSTLNYFKLVSLQSEIEILKSLDHPHIVKVYETFVEPKLCVRLVMELCEGGELYDRLAQKHRFDERTTIDIVRQMMKVLNYLHSNHVVHRDIKLENWLFRHGDDHESNEIVLIDFGLSRMYSSEEERMHKAVGTSYYAAPEVIRGNYSGMECDVWSVGVITYMLLSGTAPFDGQDDDEILLRISTHQKPKLKGHIWDKISPEAKSFVRSLLKVDPTQRATALEALDHPWLKSDVEGESGNAVIDEDIFQSLKRYTKYHELKRVAMEFIAYSMDHDEIKRLKDTFEGIDVENNGFITFSELKAALVKHGGITDEEIKQIFESLDEDHTKKIRLNEFIAGTMQAKYYQDEHKLNEAFSHLDTDNTGKITVEDLRHILGRHVSDEEIMHILEEATESNSNEVSWQEFLVFMRKDGEEKTREFRNTLVGDQAAKIVPKAVHKEQAV